MGAEAATTRNGGNTTATRGTHRLRSLAISPDLDKLLEHEEQLRRSKMTTTSVLEGLPPPPRRNRQKNPSQIASVTRSKCSSVEEQPTSSSESNPYINPAPTAEELFPSRDLVHTLAWPPTTSQQSPAFDDQPSFCQNPSATTIHFKAQTIHKGIFRVVSPIFQKMSTPTVESADYHEEDTGLCFATTHPASSIEFQATFDISSSVSPASSVHNQCHQSTLLNNNSVDPTAHRLDVIDICSPSMSSPPASQSECCNTDRAAKPPLPTTPKPVFARSSSLRKRTSSKGSFADAARRGKPATTNFLDTGERADLVRKSRKLARVFGETPNAKAMANQDGSRSGVSNPARRKQSEPDNQSKSCRGRSHLSSLSRRHSIPLSVDGVSFISVNSAFEEDNLVASSGRRSTESPTLHRGNVESNLRHQGKRHIKSNSPISFIDLSDDGSSTTTGDTISSSLSSLSETASVHRLEEERKRKRERLVKLHRFLGSQVPINLVLGIADDYAESIPQPQRTFPEKWLFDNNKNVCNTLLKSRRSNSLILNVSTLSDGVERLKDDLDDQAKAIIVRRAQKMEKVFGVAPPPMLYRIVPPPELVIRSDPDSLLSSRTDISSLSNLPYPGPKTRKQKENRSCTPESIKQLLPKGTTSNESFAQHSWGSIDSHGHSVSYDHFAHSLNSLNDIIDRDDKASLAELHHVLHDDIPASTRQTTSPPESEDDDVPTPTRRSSRIPLSGLGDRRHSLPASSSTTSLNSEHSITHLPSRPDVSSFQRRRKRAAKLTQFFGVDYRELFEDLLESIETGMEVDQRDGILHAEEVEDLLPILRKLRYKCQSFLLQGNNYHPG